jgi:hypothetical protein
MDPMLLRVAEPLLAVGIGGLSIFLSYRLFFHMPSDRDGRGNIGLPGGISIYISRVGPGIFFALLGAGVLAMSIYSQAVYMREDPQTAQTGAHSDSGYIGGITKPGSVPAPSMRAWDSLQLRLEMEFLNSLPALLRADLSEADQRTVGARIERSKLVIMSYVWETGWGRFEDFHRWIDDGAPDPIPPSLSEAAAYYRQRSAIQP